MLLSSSCLLLYPATVLSCRDSKETVTESLLCCGLIWAAQTAKLSDPRQVGPERVKFLVCLWRGANSRPLALDAGAFTTRPPMRWRRERGEKGYEHSYKEYVALNDSDKGAFGTKPCAFICIQPESSHVNWPHEKGRACLN